MGGYGSIAVFGSATVMTAIVSVTVWYVWLGRLQRAASPAREDLREQLNSNLIYLVPLRLFIGIGWLRASAEKLGDANWWNGDTLSLFLTRQLEQGRVAFPVYGTLIREIFLPGVVILAAIIAIGELAAGLGIMTGTLTNAALLGGLLMNVNFLMVGEVEPNTFYIVIQIAILVSGIGALLGVDRRLSRTWSNRLIFAQRSGCPSFSVRAHIIGIIVAVTAGLYSWMYVTDTSPAGSVRDPAMIFVVLSFLTSSWLALSLARVLIDTTDTLPASRSPGD